jgi:hypothetical protein
VAGRTEEADRAFEKVQRRAANSRRKAASYAHQALGHAHARATASDAEAACAALLKSIELSRSSCYAMGLRRAAGVRTAFRAGWSDAACVRRLDEQLRLVPTC